jgi:hypothetical protein
MVFPASHHIHLWNPYHFTASLEWIGISNPCGEAKNKGQCRCPAEISAALTIFVVTRDEVDGLAKAKLWKTCGHQRKFNIPRFRVLTLTTSDKRKESLRTLAKPADDGKRGNPMFLFACEESFSVERPATILNPIWQTPGYETWQRVS